MTASASASTLQRLRAGELQGATRLDLSCGLTEFPREILELADTLEVLNLSGNALSELPADFGRLRKLKILFCSDNRFTRMPESVGDCAELDMVGFKANRIVEVPAAALPPSLRWLILTDNAIAELPDELGRRPRLQKLMLAGNRLSRLPESMAACERLELLRIANNRFDALPDWLLALPRLSWLATAGNPMSLAGEDRAVASHPVPDIDWNALALHEVLGEGASGVIHRATWTDGNGTTHPVAVKLYKGTMTSDGSPHSEMDACIAAGAHPQLITVRGRISGRPGDAPGLVMDLVDPAFRNLAGLPSMQSCTRDVYAADARFTVPVALSIARGIASAMRQLHAHGILHGDLYAHNILLNAKGEVLLGDFGAAFFVAPDDAQAGALQRIEVRAFSCLLEELAQRCIASTPAEEASVAALRQQQARCEAVPAASRPGFAEISATLDALA